MTEVICACDRTEEMEEAGPCLLELFPADPTCIWKPKDG